MHSVASFILLSLLAMQAFAERGYLISAPKAMIAGTVEKVCITLIEVTDDVLITVSLTEDSEQREVIAREEYVMDGHDECLDLKIPDRSLDNDYYTVKLNVSGHSLSVEDQFSFADGKRIYLQSRNAKTFIQTDKPIYKPGQTVLFRILNLKGTEFKPYPSMLSMVWIENPAGVRLMQWSNVTTEDGLVELELELSEEPVLGMWKIKSLMEGKTTEQTFEVAEYVLPKFEVVVNSPPFIIVTDKIISVEICGRYTYGQPVRGAVSASICISGYSYYGEDRPCALRLVEDTGPSGCAPFYVSSEELNLVSSNYSIWQANLKVTAEFTEANTGVSLSGERVGPSISTSPFQLEIQAPENFKPGVPYFGKVKVTNPDGSPADGKLVNLVVGTNDGDILDKNFTSVNGAFDFTLKNLAIDTSRMNIRATGPGFTEPYDYHLHRYVYRVYNPYASKSIKPWFSPSGSFVQIEPVKQTLPVDSEYSFTVFYTTQDIQLVDLYIKMVSHGDIVHTDRKLIELLPEIERQRLTTTKRPSTASPTRAPEEEYESEDIPPVLEEVLIDEYWPWWPEPIDPSVEIAEPGAYGEVTLTLQVDRQMAPNCKLLLYYIRGDGEVIADSIKFKVQRKFENEVKLQFAEDETLPGANTQLELTAAPGSLCAIGVVDKSVHLMKTGNQLTKAKVFQTLDEYDLSNTYGYVDESTHCDDDDVYHPWLRGADFRKKRSIAPWWYGGGYSRYDDALTAFKTTDLVVMTNVNLETRPCTKYNTRGRGGIVYAAAPGPEAIPEAQEMDIAEADERVAFIETEVGEDENFSPLVEIRTYFPETWLWKLQRAGKSGNSVTEVEVPHTITEWIGSGFCTSSEKGVGVSETAKLTAFQPFFLSYTLPYSVIRGEKVPILVTVFNYLSQCLTVELRLSLSDDFESLEDSPVKRVCVCGSESTTVSYRIVPNTLGEIPITVLGESVNGAELCGNEAVMSDRVGARDALSENLLVEPEGIEEEYTVSSFFCPQDETDDVYESRIRLEVPDNVIDGSARATVSVIGDIMGPTLSGLDRLLTVPYGCGEQNMVSFTPNIFVLQYLTQTDQVTAEIEEKALANMRKGYQRELTYRHGDGSYSAFGERDPEGSTWLTAFVVKSFAQSDKYITIDEKDLAVSINWFKKQQNPETGCFIKRGSVHNKRLKGGVSDETSLTAFVLIAMLEAGIPAEDISVQAALSCLEDKVDNITAPYTTAIVSYAFALANSDRKAYMLEKLDSIAIRSEGSVYWGEEEKQEEEDDDRPWWWRWYHQSSSSNVEMTSYALLAQLVDVEVDGDVIGRVLPTVRWLTKQRNAYGGFSSTQDTVLALQALAAYAGQIYQDGIDMYVDFLSTDMVERFEVNHLNKLVLQRTEVPVLPDTVFVEAGGVGCALMQASVKYNVPKSPAPPSFDVSVLVSSTELVLADDVGEETEPNCSGDRRVEICARYMGEDDSSNMAVIEVKMVSGYYPNKDDLRFASKIVDQMARFDVDKNKVIFYFDEISHETMCFTFGIEHLIKVEDAKPGWVSIYDYYDKDTSAIETYDTCVERLSLNIEVEEPDGK